MRHGTLEKFFRGVFHSGTYGWILFLSGGFIFATLWAIGSGDDN